MNMQTIMPPPATYFFVTRYVCEQVSACVYMYMCLYVYTCASRYCRESVLYIPNMRFSAFYLHTRERLDVVNERPSCGNCFVLDRDKISHDLLHIFR